MVPFDRRQNFYISFPWTMCLSGVVLELRRKNESWLPWQRPLKIRKSRFRSFTTAIAEPNGKNRVKIRPVEVEIIGLTEIVKK